MNRNRRNAHKAVALLVGAFLTLPAAAVAQEEQPHRHGENREAQGQETAGMMAGTQGHRRMMGMEMMAMPAAPNPMMILGQKDALNLTESQVQRLETLRERALRSRTEHMESMQPLHREFSERAKDPGLDIAAYESVLRSMAEEHVAVHLEMARIGQEAREVLTTEQREKLQVGMEFMRGMRSMRDGMTCPMMGGESGEGH